MNYLVIARDHANALERRMEHREAHLSGITKLKEEGKVLYAVAIKEDGNMVGSVMVFDFDTKEEFETWKANEPYITGNVWNEIEVKECAVPGLFS